MELPLHQLRSTVIKLLLLLDKIGLFIFSFFGMKIAFKGLNIAVEVRMNSKSLLSARKLM